MTILHVRTVGIDLDPAAKQHLASRLITEFAIVELGHHEPAAHVGFMVLFDESTRHDTYVGGQPMGDATGTGKGVVVRAQVMAGPWSRDLTEAAIAAVGRVLEDELGVNNAEQWMTITEIPEGSWGYGGRAISIEQLAGAFTPERQAVIEAQLSG